jgi:coatomer subunit delta
MQLGKKNKTTDAFKQIQGDLPVDDTPLVSPPSAAPQQSEPAGRTSVSGDAIHVTVTENISAKLSREGQLESFNVKGDLQLRITDPSLTKVKLDLQANPSHGAQFRTHPNVDKAIFNSSKRIQLRDPSRGFPVNNSVGVLRWSATAKEDDSSVLPITFTVWVNKGNDTTYTVTVEYELTGGDNLRDVSVTIPYSTSEPAVSSFDAMYEVAGDSLEWTIGPVDEGNSSGSFEFEAQADDEGDFFPMKVSFAKTTPFVDVDVTSITLVDEGEPMSFSREVKSGADSYLIE